MSRDNFMVYVDRDGKMPQLRHRAWDCKSHPFYTRYRGNRPVAIHGPVDVVASRSPVDGILKVYDYAASEFVVASTVPQE